MISQYQKVFLVSATKPLVGATCLVSAYHLLLPVSGKKYLAVATYYLMSISMVHRNSGMQSQRTQIGTLNLSLPPSTVPTVTSPLNSNNTQPNSTPKRDFPREVSFSAINRKSHHISQELRKPNQTHPLRETERNRKERETGCFCQKPTTT